MLEYTSDKGESEGSESDSGKGEKEPPKKRSKSVERAKKSLYHEVRQSTCQNNPMIWYEYSEYMAHHNAYMAKVVAMHEPEGYVEAAKYPNTLSLRLGW